MTCSLYGDLLAAGVPMENHESDLYFKDGPEARAILARFPHSAKLAERFPSALDGSAWWEVAFAWLPWWEMLAIEDAQLVRYTAMRVQELIEPDDLRD